MISEWRRQSKSAGLWHWQYQTFEHGSILCWTARWRYALETPLSLSLSLFHVLRSFWRGHMRCVRLEWRTDWIDCERSLFTPCSWLRRRNVKNPSVASAASSVALHGLPEADHCEQRIEYRTRIAKPVTLFHHSHRIVDSSQQSSPSISPKNCFKYGKFWGVDNFSYRLDRSTALCCVSAWSGMSSGHLTSGG